MDINTIRKDFPILSRAINGHPLVYLDNAATTHKPTVVLEAMDNYYRQHNANVHRGIHTLGDESTQAYHRARTIIAGFFETNHEQLLLTRNTTEAINLLALGWADKTISSGEVMITSLLEHHSNFVPWQQLAESKQANLEVVDVTTSAEIDLADLEKKIKAAGKKLRLITLCQLSNATGSVLDVAKVVALRDRYAPKALVAIDGAQAAAVTPIRFDSSGVDAYTFSGHKLYGPMGIGGLLVSKRLLSVLEPIFYGGGMINEVSLEKTTLAIDSERFDAGTPNVAGAVGLAAALDYLQSLGIEWLQNHSQELVAYTIKSLSTLPFVTVIGPSNHRLGSVAFVVKGVHAHDVAQILDQEGIAVRSGHHCTMPLHTHFDWTATTRASFGVYNQKSDIDALIVGLMRVAKVFSL